MLTRNFFDRNSRFGQVGGGRRRSMLGRGPAVGRLLGLAMIAGGAAGLMAAPGVAAQSDHMEWEPGEGTHEEEWYDPTDWFDDDFDGIRGPDTDNEYDWELSDYRTYEADTLAYYDDDVYDAAWWYDAGSLLYSDGYYDGYVDASDDDVYGYDVDVIGSDLASNYKDGYIDGYYDAFYDRERGYDLDWTYYLYTVPVDRGREMAQKERRKDGDRSRGDRAERAERAGTDEMSDRQASKDAKAKEMSRIRGELTRIERVRWGNRPEKLDGYLMLRLTMDDGRSCVVDLGKKASRGVLDTGDKVTIHGRRMTVGGKKIVDAQRLSVNGEQLWNSSSSKRPERMSRKD